MSELSHYDLFFAFSLREAAYLAAGVDPSGSPDDVRGEVIREAMEHGLNGTFCHAVRALTDGPARSLLPEWALIPTEIQRLLGLGEPAFGNAKEAARWLHELAQRRNRNSNPLSFDRDELHRWFKAKGLGFKPIYAFIPPMDEPARQDPGQSANGPIGPRERTTYLTVIGALLELVLNHRDGRSSQSAVIVELVDNYRDKPGISKKGLETKFAEAKRSLTS